MGSSLTAFNIPSACLTSHYLLSLSESGIFISSWGIANICNSEGLVVTLYLTVCLFSALPVNPADSLQPL